MFLNLPSFDSFNFNERFVAETLGKFDKLGNLNWKNFIDDPLSRHVIHDFNAPLALSRAVALQYQERRVKNVHHEEEGIRWIVAKEGN